MIALDRSSCGLFAWNKILLNTQNASIGFLQSVIDPNNWHIQFSGKNIPQYLCQSAQVVSESGVFVLLSV